MSKFSFTSLAQTIIDSAVLPACNATDKAVAFGVPAVMNKTQNWVGVIADKTNTVSEKIAKRMESASRESNKQYNEAKARFESPVVKPAVKAEVGVTNDAALQMMFNLWVVMTPAEKMDIAVKNMAMFTQLVSLENANKR